MEIGVREFRANLSKCIDHVRRGEDIVLTERGIPVARIIPAAAKTPLERLVAAGVVRLPQKPKGAPPKPIRARGTVSDIVIEERR
ncbi:MAG: type II toxin-antitoxin system Phd/YefM family antitoxin [Actinomycetota bacterium]|nr:type II toxin-antitoxin system prevent-host-death family antitoxin [Actinomycetota bacterium]